MKIFHRGLILSALPLLVELLLIGSLSFVLQKSESERVTEQIYRRVASLQARVFGHLCMTPYLLSLKIYTKSDKVGILFNKELREIVEDAWEIRDFCIKNPIIPKAAAEHELSVITMLRRAWLDADRDCNAPGVSAQAGLDMLTDSMESLEKLVDKDIADAFVKGDQQTVEYQQRLEGTRRLLFIVLAVGAFANLALTIALAIFYRQTILERIKIIAKNTEALS
ncbi:MAG: hypothetical protein K2X81_09850, partial [Candidatus Obscuribacterales bacterium]|nr:hypothetical protein [Candidatus Obscuribacterales bacterium]